MTNLTATRGDDETYRFAITGPDPDTHVVGPVDLTAASVRFTAKAKITDSDDGAALVKTEADGIAIDDDPTSGLLTVSLVPDDTSSLPSRRVVLLWDLQVTVGGRVRTVDGGQLVVSPDVSRTSP